MFRWIQQELISKRWSRGLLVVCCIAGCKQIVTAQSVGNGLYFITSNASTYNVDGGGAVTNGQATIQHIPGSGNTNQEWLLTSNGSGSYSVLSLSSGMALDTGSSTTAGGDIVTNYPVAASASQKWTIQSLGSGLYQFIDVNSGNALDNDSSTTTGTALTQQVANSSLTSQQWKLTPVTIGATPPFTTYEAESAALAGGASVVTFSPPATTEFSSPQLEASGHAYVNLGGTGQSVTFTNNTGKAMNFINIRYSIPDASSGGGITATLDMYVNGSMTPQAITLSSAQTWVYESASSYNGMSQNPSDGNPHVFWDEAHAFLSTPIPNGGTITLKKDSSNSASFYNIDLIDLEAPPAPLSQPTNSLSLSADCGATPNNPSSDSTNALQSCINTAQSSGKSVWIPQGTFYLTAQTNITTNGVTLQGAGMWYSTLYSNPVIPTTTTRNVLLPVGGTLENFAIDGNATSRNASDGNRGAINIKGNNWVIKNLWISHEGAGIWAEGANNLIENCRLNNTWADGININNGSGAVGNNTGNNMTVINNFIRGSGDDGIAVNDTAAANQMTGNVVINNTTVAPWWANNLGVYGATGTLVSNNLLHDSVKLYGIYVGIFGTAGGDVGSAFVEGNTVLRGGSFGYGFQNGGIGVGINSSVPANNSGMYIRGNTVSNAMFDGVHLDTGLAMQIDNNTVISPGTYGFTIDASSKGSASMVCNTVQTPGTGDYINHSSSSNFTVNGTCNNTFTVP